jgi:DNA-binding CsgD family transcriptional regulator/catechol 2,3-dioxygenase-like lactoylglutathione lyase family enzyme
MASTHKPRSKASSGRPRYDDILTPGEWRVVHAIKHGMTNREIAARQRVTVDAVKYHVANAMGKLGLDSRGALRNWSRLPKATALGRLKAAAPAPKEKVRQRAIVMASPVAVGPIGQVSRTVQDVARSQEWYAKVLGLPHLYTFGQMTFFDCAGTRLILTQHGPAAVSESILYFLVPDIVEAHKELSSRGVEFINAPHLIHRHADGTEEWMAFFKDLEGRPLALMSPVRP